VYLGSGGEGVRLDLPRLRQAWRRDFNGAQSGGKRVSLADLIVLGGYRPS